jgi:hypothetical protein
MRLSSTYHVECVCGHAVDLTATEGQCGHCGRLIELHWGETDGLGHDARGTVALAADGQEAA